MKIQCNWEMSYWKEKQLIQCKYWSKHYASENITQWKTIKHFGILSKNLF